MLTIDEAIKSKFDNNHVRAVVNVMYTANWYKNHHQEFLADYEITGQQYNILRILRGAKDFLPMTEVKNRMIEKSPNTTRLADKLLENKYIERKRCDNDRRVVYVKITDKGLAILAEIDDKKDKQPNDLVKTNLTEDEARMLSHLLDKLRNEK
jgi:MarR family transcriptional regulator, 2-MHQ and catechol-resistance regulon repressor